MTTPTKDPLTTITIADALKFPEGTPIPRMVGKLTHIFGYKSGEGDFGPYTSQSGVIADESGTNKILFTIWNKPSIPEDYMGRTLIFRSGAGKKPSMTLKSDFKDSSKRTLNVTKSCHVLTEDEENDNIPMDYPEKPNEPSRATPREFLCKDEPKANVEPKKAISSDGVSVVKHRVMQLVNLRTICDHAARSAYPVSNDEFVKEIGTSIFIQATREGLHDKLPNNKPLDANLTKNKPEESEPEFLPAEEF